MKFTGQEAFPRQLDAVWEQLTDLAGMAKIIPDLDRVDGIWMINSVRGWVPISPVYAGSPR